MCTSLQVQKRQISIKPIKSILPNGGTGWVWKCLVGDNIVRNAGGQRYPGSSVASSGDCSGQAVKLRPGPGSYLPCPCLAAYTRLTPTQHKHGECHNLGEHLLLYLPLVRIHNTHLCFVQHCIVHLFNAITLKPTSEDDAIAIIHLHQTSEVEVETTSTYV